MKTASPYCILGIMILFSGCKKEESSDFSVSGKLIINGAPIKNATVDIDGLEQYKTTTNSEVYFRVFVLNEYGQLGGSNIISVASINKNLLAGGEFENSNDLSYWDLTGDIGIDNTDFHSGIGSALLSSTIDTVTNVISGTIERWPVTENEMSIGIDLETDRDYTISFWYKLSGFGYMMYPFNFYYYQNNQEKINTTIYDYNWAGTWIPLSPFKVLEDTGWLFFSKTFNSDSDANAVFHITSQVENVWIDELKIKIVE